MIRKMNERGAGHIEFVTSIVLFIVIVAGAVYFLSPTRSARTIESSLEYTFNEIRSYSNVELKIDSVKIMPYGLTSTSGIVSVPIDADGNSVRVEKQNGDKITYGSGPNKICFNYAESAYDGGYFATIKIGEDFTSPSEISCPDAVEGTYQISSSAKRKFVSEAKIAELKSRYEGNSYLELKEDFNLPGNEFAFSLLFLDGEEDNIDASKSIPSGLEVFSNSKRVEVLREDGSSEFAELVIWVW